MLQETFVAVWHNAGQYRAKAEVGAWIWGIARRQAAQWLRKEERPEVPWEAHHPADLALATALLARSPNVGMSMGLTSWALVVLGGKAATEQWATAVAEATLIPFYLVSALILIAVALYAASGKREDIALWQ